MVLSMIFVSIYCCAHLERGTVVPVIMDLLLQSLDFFCNLLCRYLDTEGILEHESVGSWSAAAYTSTPGCWCLLMLPCLAIDG